MKYEVTVTGIGDLALEMMEHMGGLILFDECAPAELAEISVLHTTGALQGELAVGDKVIFGKNEYVITAIGDEAVRTLKEMGHCTFKFTGHDAVELPGQIELKNEEVQPHIAVGDTIRIG